METTGNSVYTEEFDNQGRTLMIEKWYLEASSTCPLIVYKFNINFTVYNGDAAMTNYFYLKSSVGLTMVIASQLRTVVCCYFINITTGVSKQEEFKN